MVDGVMDGSAVGAQFLVCGGGWARGDFTLDPLLEWLFLGDLTGCLETCYDGSGVVALWVGEVAEVKGWLDGWVGGGEVEPAPGAGTGDVGGDAEGVGGDVVAETAGVDAEWDLVAVHHDVGAVTIEPGCVDGLAAKEDTCIGVHGGLVWWNGLVELPHDDGFGVVDQVLSHARHVLDDGDGERGELLAWSNAREQEETGGVDCASAEDGLPLGAEGQFGTRLESDVNSGHGVSADINLGYPGVSQDGEIGLLLRSAEDGVDVGNAGTAAAAVIRVIRHREEAGSLGQSALRANGLVKVGNNGDVERGRAGLHPVLAELVAMPGVDGLHGVAEIIDHTSEGVEAPALAAFALPHFAVVFKRTEGN
ncbi:uncharacterized protein TERG_11965 [Trichophyton rubrum CBS 118892]|uniref:Uncharacterized protein n=1 Tax=Trichophyton rubrum (strain ATCC MYA-4607 / CBS 118892) TaxID=559305 RepID=A0A080WLY2_TRIRC|nr:uncharacterized protein TERG_11965 [Trichophyton rubrum CBS 118892]KFL61125.1 hypothetical protein TERG_11965 [Trichophyton rubrum CBS 118892]